VGNWKLVRRLGQGGMGVVYLAERIDGQFKQDAALKLVRHGVDTKQVIARFDVERQALSVSTCSFRSAKGSSTLARSRPI